VFIKSKNEKYEAIRQLILQSEFEEAIASIDQLLPTLRDKEDQISLNLMKCCALKWTGKIKPTFELARSLEQEAQEYSFPLLRTDALYAQASAMCLMGDFDKSLNHLTLCSQLLDESKRIILLKLEIRNAWHLQLKAWNQFQLGEYKDAESFSHQALEIFTQYNDRYGIGYCFHILGLIYITLGDIEKGEKYFQQAIEVRREIGDQRGEGIVLLSLGVREAQRGDLLSAIDLYKQALSIFIKINAKSNMITCYYSLGEAYMLMGELDLALSILQKSLAHSKDLNRKDRIYESLAAIAMVYQYQGKLEDAYSILKSTLLDPASIPDKRAKQWFLFALLKLTLELGEFTSALTLYEEFEKDRGPGTPPVFKQYQKVAEALILNLSDRSVNKVRAQELLLEVAHEDILEIVVTADAILHLCTFYVDEFRLTGNKEALADALTWIDHLSSIAKQFHSYSLLVEVSILHAQLFLFKLNFDKAQEYLFQAQLLCDEKGLTTLGNKILETKNSLLSQITRWQGITDHQPSSQEIAEFSQIEALLTRMLHKKQDRSNEEMQDYLMRAKEFTDAWEERK
jgi:tetratricopeptide (TPR) repeat protein